MNNQYCPFIILSLLGSTNDTSNMVINLLLILPGVLGQLRVKDVQTKQTVPDNLIVLGKIYIWFGFLQYLWYFIDMGAQCSIKNSRYIGGKARPVCCISSQTSQYFFQLQQEFCYLGVIGR
eukprot:TRINITY_DN8785_c0_g1_i2.p2 TRINITY_DN8785_c0_g1~~TRINITY_DN8785_c0_g1_i2.p2  ORF type:complete len:121 (+),score=0.53 TRINITY_DN8785_c0_g1_i2:346-708(+)